MIKKTRGDQEQQNENLFFSHIFRYLIDKKSCVFANKQQVYSMGLETHRLYVVRVCYALNIYKWFQINLFDMMNL